MFQCLCSFTVLFFSFLRFFFMFSFLFLTKENDIQPPICFYFSKTATTTKRWSFRYVFRSRASYYCINHIQYIAYIVMALHFIEPKQVLEFNCAQFLFFIIIIIIVLRLKFYFLFSILKLIWLNSKNENQFLGC